MADKNVPVKGMTQLYKERDDKYYDKITLKGKKPLRAMIEKAIESLGSDVSINKFVLDSVYTRLGEMGITEESVSSADE